jgi:hypothetical protein
MRTLSGRRSSGPTPPTARNRVTSLPTARLLRADDERDTRDVQANRVVDHELSEHPGGHAGAANGVGMVAARRVKVTVSLSVPTDSAQCRS